MKQMPRKRKKRQPSNTDIFQMMFETEEKAKEMLKLGVDGIGTNRLDIVLPLVHR
jgi:hypothetical protein